MPNPKCRCASAITSRLLALLCREILRHERYFHRCCAVPWRCGLLLFAVALQFLTGVTQRFRTRSLVHYYMKLGTITNCVTTERRPSHFRSGTRQGFVDFIGNACATLSRWAIAPVFGKATAANAVRLIKSKAAQYFELLTPFPRQSKCLTHSATQ